jgi:hypothetical protein
MEIDGYAIYLGASCGLVLASRERKTVFSDMGLINEIYRPQNGFVPIGDRFTWEPGRRFRQKIKGLAEGRTHPVECGENYPQ